MSGNRPQPPFSAGVFATVVIVVALFALYKALV